MRVNVYGEELTDRIELVTKTVEEPAKEMSEFDGPTQKFTFYGLRFWLKFPNQDWWIHRKVDGEDDDDSSAITVWAPTREKLVTLLVDGLRAIGASGMEMVAIDHPGTVMVPPMPHSRACGLVPHEHGVACHNNCPTCGGRPEFSDEDAPGVTAYGYQQRSDS